MAIKRFFAEVNGSDGVFVATCYDADVSAEGPTSEAATASLVEELLIFLGEGARLSTLTVTPGAHRYVDIDVPERTSVSVAT
jgi:hypothetical protein